MATSFLTRAGSIAALALAAIMPASAFGIGLQPTTVEIEVEPGERQRQVINLGNVHQEETISLTIGLADWDLDQTGQIQLAAPGETTDSAAEWVRFSPAFVTLEPGESEQIVVDMSAPIRTEREGDFRFALIASTILPESRSGQSGVWKKYQIASLFYLTMGDALSAPTIEEASVVRAPDGTQSLKLDVSNSGNAHARLRGDVEITGDRGDRIAMPVANLVVLDEASRTYKMTLSEDLPANPQVKVTLENIFSPQSNGGSAALPAYTAPLVIKEAAAPTAPETSLE